MGSMVCMIRRAIFFKQGVDVPKFLTCIVCISRLQGHYLSSNAPASAPGGQSKTSFVVS